MDKRPELTKEISIIDFKDFYWLKSELQQFCRQEGLRTSGSKGDLLIRIEEFLRTGKKPVVRKSSYHPKSNFDWHTGTLKFATIITDNYRNTEQVRAFFSDQLGKPFKFNVRFMDWMKKNVGKTLGDALQEHKRMEVEKKDTSKHKVIAPQFEYNTYLRDFLADNPDKTREDGIRLWNVKKRQRGHNRYEQADLNFLDQGKD